LDDEIANLKENARDFAAINDAERAVKDLHGELDNIKILLDRDIQARYQADAAIDFAAINDAERADTARKNLIEQEDGTIERIR